MFLKINFSNQFFIHSFKSCLKHQEHQHQVEVVDNELIEL